MLGIKETIQSIEEGIKAVYDGARSLGVEFSGERNLKNIPELISLALKTPKGNGTLTDLKLALYTDDPEKYYPLGSEISDTYDGEDSPWIVVDYGTNDVSLHRKYATDYGTMFHSDNTLMVLSYNNSDIFAFLRDVYPTRCSKECLETISPFYTTTTGALAGIKFVLPTPYMMNAASTSGNSGTAFAYYRDQADTGVEGSANCEKRAKTDREGNPRAWWVNYVHSSRQDDGSYQTRAGGFRPDGTYYASLVTSPSRAVCPVAKIRKDN